MQQPTNIIDTMHIPITLLHIGVNIRVIFMYLLHIFPKLYKLFLYVRSRIGYVD